MSLIVLTGNPELINSPVGLSTDNALVLIHGSKLPVGGLPERDPWSRFDRR